MSFITQAFAQDAAVATTDAAAAAPNMLVTMAPLVLVFFVFYLLVIRPQNKRLLEHRKTINELQKGDKVVTGGGLIATVKKMIGDNEVLLEIGTNEVVALRSTIMMTYKPETAASKTDVATSKHSEKK